MRSKSKISKLDYRTRNHIQNIAIAAGVILSEEQMQQFAGYRASQAFAQSTDKQILYIVLTHGQREDFDRKRYQ